MAKDVSIYSVIKAPVITERTTRLAPLNQYVFCVDKTANKIDIRRAVEKIYNVKVTRVASMIVKGKIKRLRANQPGKKPDWKKAIVTLKKGCEIKFT